MHRALCLTVPKMRRKSVDNLGHTGKQAAAGAHGPPAKFSGGGGYRRKRAQERVPPHTIFYFFNVYSTH
jgi:hypothetical protein